MVFAPRRLLLLATLAGLLASGRGFGQATLPPAEAANEALPTPSVLETPPTANPSVLPELPPSPAPLFAAPSASFPQATPPDFPYSLHRDRPSAGTPTATLP